MFVTVSDVMFVTANEIFVSVSDIVVTASGIFFVTTSDMICVIVGGIFWWSRMSEQYCDIKFVFLLLCLVFMFVIAKEDNTWTVKAVVLL